MRKWYGKAPEDIFELELSKILSQIQINEDRIRQVFFPEEVEENRENGKFSAILTIEGPAGFGYDPALLENLWQIGFRISTLGWNEKNALTGSHATGGGLTDLGREYVPHGDMASLYKHYGLDGQSIADHILEVGQIED